MVGLNKKICPRSGRNILDTPSLKNLASLYRRANGQVIRIEEGINVSNEQYDPKKMSKVAYGRANGQVIRMEGGINVK